MALSMVKWWIGNVGTSSDTKLMYDKELSYQIWGTAVGARKGLYAGVLRDSADQNLGKRRGVRSKSLKYWWRFRKMESWWILLDALARILCFKVGWFPMTYLGMPLGAHYKDSSIWSPIIEMM